MKTSILAAIRCCLMFLVPTVTYAISAQWDLDPISGDWNTPANWTPMTVPNGPADTATLGLSKTTDVSISANTEVNGITFTAAATNPYTITASPGLTLTISGVGITNNSGLTQNLATVAGGEIRFANNATAGSNVSISNEGGTTNFFNHSSAAGASIFNLDGGSTNFFNRSTAGNSAISVDSNSDPVQFLDNSTAGSATIALVDSFLIFANNSTAGNSSIDNFSGLTSFLNGSTAGNSSIGAGVEAFVEFSDNSTAGNSSISAVEESFVTFMDNSTAGSATIALFDDGFLDFSNTSTAANASIFAPGGGFISFGGSSRGGTAAIVISGRSSLSGRGSSLDISGHSAPGVTIGSLEEDEIATVFLGGNNLTIGSNNLSTTFSGAIQDGGSFPVGGTGGSLTKIGSGTLILSGANTYTGDTNINRGVLQVDGSITSNTFVNHGGTLAGTGTINGNVTNNGRVSPGDALGVPGMLTVVHNYTQAEFATLMIQIAGMGSDQFSVLNVLGNANLNGFLDPVLLNGFVPTIGDSFTFLNYASFTGEFSHINHQVFDNGMLQWSVMYQANHAILTVEQHVPDHGSTFLLLTLGLLGLVTYRRQLLRGQSRTL